MTPRGEPGIDSSGAAGHSFRPMNRAARFFAFFGFYAPQSTGGSIHA
jgi:hypothetical protein